MKTKSPSRKSPSKVAPRTARRTVGKRKTPQFASILVPLDFSGKSRQALAAAIPLAEQHGGKIILLHVVEPPLVRSVPEFPTYVPVPIADLVKAATARLNAMARKLVKPSILSAVLVEVGQPSIEIVEVARRRKVDLIAVASVGRTGLKRLLLGSTAESVVRHAPCAVLTLRKR
ncbi:MAG: universal stress protein [Opitutaceae bacterium]|nr:universal stress protein [Opitutaceae bacterium]